MLPSVWNSMKRFTSSIKCGNRAQGSGSCSILWRLFWKMPSDVLSAFVDIICKESKERDMTKEYAAKLLMKFPHVLFTL